jgi:ISXO2-like transposase domain
MGILSETKEEAEKIGGPGIRIQVDETAICNGLVINNSSSSYDDLKGIQWIVGGVVEGDSRKFFVELVRNRKHETILGVFKRFINPGSIIVTDGYPSYPRAVIYLDHHIL